MSKFNLSQCMTGTSGLYQAGGWSCLLTVSGGQMGRSAWLARLINRMLLCWSDYSAWSPPRLAASSASVVVVPAVSCCAVFDPAHIVLG